MRLDRTPRRPNQRAVVAAEPPWTNMTRPGTSVQAGEPEPETDSVSAARELAPALKVKRPVS